MREAISNTGPTGAIPTDAADDSWAFLSEFEAPPLPPPFDGFLTQQATSHNGLQVAKVLEPALIQLVASGELNSQELKELQKSFEQLSNQPGGIGAALEQLAASQNANLATATQATTQHLSRPLLATLRTLPTDDDGHFWVQGLGNGGSLDPQHGSAGLKHDTQGLLLGADWAVDHAWRVGVMGAKTSSRFDALRYAADLDSWHLGGYAVRQDGPFALRLGAIYSNHGRAEQTAASACSITTTRSKANTTPAARHCSPNWAINWAAVIPLSNPSSASATNAISAIVSKRAAA